MSKRESLEQIVQAIREMLDNLDNATAMMALQLVQTGYAIGVADAARKSD